MIHRLLIGLALAVLFFSPAVARAAAPHGESSAWTLATPVNLPATATEGEWVSLFNGKDLTGWKLPNPPSNEFSSITEKKNESGQVVAFIGTQAKSNQQVTLWCVEDGCIVGAGPPSHLFSERGDFENFHYRIEAKISHGGNSGQYFRAEFGPGFPKGYEAQINATHADRVKTGSLYPANGLGKERAKHTVLDQAPHQPDEWFTQEVIAVGPKITILVNGRQTVEYTIPEPYFKKGHFALQAHHPGSVITVRKIEVKELK